MGHPKVTPRNGNNSKTVGLGGGFQRIYVTIDMYIYISTQGVLRQSVSRLCSKMFLLTLYLWK